MFKGECPQQELRDAVYAKVAQSVEKETQHSAAGTMMGMSGHPGENLGAVGIFGLH